MRQDLTNVHPELRQFVKRMPNFTFSRWNLWLFRLLGRLNLAGKIPEDISVENIYIPAQDGTTKIRLRVYHPNETNRVVPALVWFHGGGFIIGVPEQNDAYCIQIARETGITIFSVDYRLAAFPTPLNDAYTALKWVSDNAASWNIDPQRIAIGGESAGGGLAAALAQLAADRKEVKPIFQLLVYPMLDDRTVVREDILDRSYLVWNQDSNRFGWESYLGTGNCGTADLPPYSVSARREDLSALPPAWIGVGSLDLFHDEDVIYAQRLKECGVPCELNVIQGAFHGFDVAGTEYSVVREFRQLQVNALKKYLR